MPPSQPDEHSFAYPATDIAALRASLDSMRGYSPYAALVDVVQIAQAEFGYNGTFNEAAAILNTFENIEVVETEESIEQSQVIWKSEEFG